MPERKTRVLIVDDSVFARRIVSDILGSSSQIEVVGTALNGLDGLAKVKKLRPDVVTMDVEMPELDGISTLRRIMEECPTPVVMVSSLTVEGARESIQAFRYGAADVIAKPHGTHSIGMGAQRDDLISKVLAAAAIDVARIQPIATPIVRQIQRATPVDVLRFPVVVIASSTGGPRALRTVIPNLTSSAGVAYVVVQHLPEGFSGPMAADLNTTTELNVREAAEGDHLSSGDLLFAKAGYHMVINKRGDVSVTSTPPLWGVRPSADVTMASLVPVYGRRLIGVILTGMGHDGAGGLRLIKEAGGVTIAEHQSTCVVYGMPRSAIESGCVDIVAPLQHIAEAVNASVMATSTGRAKTRERAA